MASTATERESEKHWLDRAMPWFVAGLSAIILCLVAMSASRAILRRAKENQARALVHGIVIGAEGFYSAYGSWPSATGVFAELLGANPRGILFFDPPPASILPSKTIVDPWGHPLIYDGISGGVPHAHSIGPNGIDEHGAPGTDDISS